MPRSNGETDYAKILLCALCIAFMMSVMISPGLWVIKNTYEQQEKANENQVDSLLREIGELKDKLIMCEGSP